MSDFVPRVVYDSKPFESIAEFEIKNFREIKFKQQILSKILMPGLNVECDLSFSFDQEVTNPYYNLTEETVKVYASITGFDEALWNSTYHQLQVTAKSSRGSCTFADSDLISLCKKDFIGVLNSSVNYWSVKNNLLLPNGSLVVVISIKIYSKTGPIKTHGMNFDRNEVAKMNFKMLETGSFSDFKFLVENKELKHEFRVHRSILATNSPVFEKMFSADMSESSSGQCVIKDIKPEIFKHMLDFIYARKIPQDIGDVAKDLYEAAHYYEIAKLKEICKEELPSKLSARNAVEMYKFAWIYDLNELKIEAWKIIKELKHEFKVHRNILATASPVFQELFSADISESSSGQCLINGINPEIFKHMLDFIYARIIPEDICDVAKDLYEAAHYYEIEMLKEICEEELPSKLSAKNAVEMYKFAWIYDLNELKIEAWKIIKRDIIKDNNLGDDKMLSVELVDEILQYKKKMDELLKKASE